MTPHDRLLDPSIDIRSRLFITQLFTGLLSTIYDFSCGIFESFLMVFLTMLKFFGYVDSLGNFFAYAMSSSLLFVRYAMDIELSGQNNSI